MHQDKYERSQVFTLTGSVFVETKFQITAGNIKAKRDTAIPEINSGTYCEN